MKKIFKAGFFWIYVFVIARTRNVLRAIAGTCHTTVLLYHRVSDEELDSITVMPAQFQRQLDILKLHYKVLSMEEFLNSRGCPRRRPSVVITFDDGYHDNYHAAVLMRKAAVPATFFISTGIVGTLGRFPKDAQMRRTLPVLSWEDVQEMAGWGFHFANHTVTHLEMGAARVEVSLSEIKQASRDLEQRLGSRSRSNWFAYPFGRPHNIKREIFSRLHELGVDYCFSAYGGVNRVDFDPHDILRQGVNHTFGRIAFMALVEGYHVKLPKSATVVATESPA